MVDQGNHNTSGMGSPLSIAAFSSCFIYGLPCDFCTVL